MWGGGRILDLLPSPCLTHEETDFRSIPIDCDIQLVGHFPVKSPRNVREAAAEASAGETNVRIAINTAPPHHASNNITIV